LAQRARIILACAAGQSDTTVATRLRVATPTVGQGRARFVAPRLEGLPDAPRPGVRGRSQSAISRLWRALGRQPHRPETVQLSKEPLFVEKVRDSVGLSLQPPDKAVGLCVDETAPLRALDRT